MDNRKYVFIFRPTTFARLSIMTVQHLLRTLHSWWMCFKCRLQFSCIEAVFMFSSSQDFTNGSGSHNGNGGPASEIKLAMT